MEEVKPMRIACCIWALSGSETEILRQVRDIGFDCIDIQPTHLQSLESRLLAQELGLRVSCVGASFGLPAGASLDHLDESLRLAAIDHVGTAIEQAAEIGAGTVYVIPGNNPAPAAIEEFEKSLVSLADVAAAHAVKLAIEHFPGTALPSAGETLELIRALGHDNLYLLYDSGHIQMSGEEPASVITNAGDRLGYVHFDDNDGLSDLHWSLLDGVMTEESLAATLRALDAVDYQGAVSLELSPALANPARALGGSRDILMRARHQGWMNG